MPKKAKRFAESNDVTRITRGANRPLVPSPRLADIHRRKCVRERSFSAFRRFAGGRLARNQS